MLWEKKQNRKGDLRALKASFWRSRNKNQPEVKALTGEATVWFSRPPGLTTLPRPEGVPTVVMFRFL